MSADTFARIGNRDIPALSKDLASLEVQAKRDVRPFM